MCKSWCPENGDDRRKGQNVCRCMLKEKKCGEGKLLPVAQMIIARSAKLL